jgi:hypothetical protein
MSLIVLLLTFLVDIEGAAGHGQFQLDSMFPSSWVSFITSWCDTLAYCGTTLIGLLVAPAAFRGRAFGGAAASMVVAIAATTLMAMLLMTNPASAADVATKAPAANLFAKPYTLTSCGAYFGVNSIGSNSSISGPSVAAGTQVVQGGIGGQVGYGCPINSATGSFWFAELMVDATNLNGSTNGLALNGPAEFTERFGAGTPINSILSMIVPASANTAIPSLPTLPNGITAGAANPYLFVALHQKDISASNGLSSNREWLMSYGVGVGVRYLLSNALVADVFAEYQANTDTLCVGPVGSASCVKPGQGAMVGIAFDY